MFLNKPIKSSTEHDHVEEIDVDSQKNGEGQKGIEEDDDEVQLVPRSSLLVFSFWIFEVEDGPEILISDFILTPPFPLIDKDRPQFHC